MKKKRSMKGDILIQRNAKENYISGLRNNKQEHLSRKNSESSLPHTHQHKKEGFTIKKHNKCLTKTNNLFRFHMNISNKPCLS
jgi:hypothetical protein